MILGIDNFLYCYFCKCKLMALYFPCDCLQLKEADLGGKTKLEKINELCHF